MRGYGTQHRCAVRKPCAFASLLLPRLFYGCSYVFHLSGDNSRDRYVKGS